MIWRLTYCNKEGTEARVDIIKGDRTPIEVVQGSGNPFTLSYRLDKNDKSGHIMTSSADIEFFETDTFNIDDLKTSNETELKVEYFEGDVLTWSGFILPDFFSKEIGSPSIVRMTASDRLTALKGVTLSDLPERVSLSYLIERCLSKTGLSLALISQVQIYQGSTNILDSEILSQRITDVRGRSISCYDILISIMVGTNSTIRQGAGQWLVYNKLEHEQRTPTILFDKVERGAIRTIQPVASSVGVYHEFGGGQIYPENHDFSNGLTSWTAVNGFDASIDNRQVIKYYYSGGRYIPAYGEVGDSNYVLNKYNNLFADASSPYLKSDTIGVIYPAEKNFNVEVEINATNAMVAPTNTAVDFAIIIEGNGNTLSMDGSGLFNEVTGGKPFIHRMLFPRAMPTDGGFTNKAATISERVKGLAVSPDDNFEGYTIHVRIYGSGGSFQSLIHSVSLKFSSVNEAPKGNLYKTAQGSNFTKIHDIETTIFGDYITSGLNGYFYNYPLDDTSNLYLPSGELSPPQWVTAFDTTERPLLHHISRQKSRLFSVAHDILKANINVESFDPLAVFQDCKGGKYVVVSASFDFLRSDVDVELEQIAYDGEILKRDFIYSYFGEGENNIKSIGGIAGGGVGGGMTDGQLEMLTNLANWWKLDAENDAIYSEKSVYSLKGVSALGLGSEGGGGGGDFDRLDAWADYDSTKAGWVLSALLGYDLHTRVNSLEEGVGSSNIGVVVNGTGNAITGVSPSGNTLTFEKSSTFAHSNDSRIINGQTAFGWGNHASVGYALNSALTAHISNGTANAKHLTDAQLAYLNDLIGWWKVDASGNLYTEKNLYSTKGVSALGVGDIGGSGGGIDMLDSWANYTSEKANFYVPASLLVPFRNDTLSRLTSLESGSATSITTTGIGNAITSLTKSGSVITANKGLSFALESHTHDDRYRRWYRDQGIDVDANRKENTYLSGYRWINTPVGGVGILETNNQYSNDWVTQEFTLIGSQSRKFIRSFYGGTTWGNWFEFWHSGNLTSLSQLTDNIGVATHIADKANPHSVTTDQIGAVDRTTNQSIGGAKTFTALLTASGGVKTPKVDFGNGFTVEPSGTELVFKYNGVIKQRMLSDGTILATGGVTALSGGTSGRT